jgi:hypothetical protein
MTKLKSVIEAVKKNEADSDLPKSITIRYVGGRKSALLYGGSITPGVARVSGVIPHGSEIYLDSELLSDLEKALGK